MPRGKKVCPECKAEAGPRTSLCDCGYKFEFKIDKPKEAKPPKAEKASPENIIASLQKEFPGYAGQNIIIAPVGQCPVYPTEDALAWIEEMKSFALEHNIYYSNTALRYYYAQTYGRFSQEYKQLETVLHKA